MPKTTSLLPEPLEAPDFYNSLPAEDKQAALTTYVEQQRAKDPGVFGDKATPDLVDAASNLLTAQRIQSIPVIGSAFQKANEIQGAISDKVSSLAQAVGVPKRGADWAGGLTGTLAVAAPVATVTGIATGLLTKNPIVGESAAAAAIGTLQAGQELVSSGRKDVAIATALASILTGPAGRLGVKATRALEGTEALDTLLGRSVEGAGTAENAKAVSQAILESFNPITKRELAAKHIAQAAVSLPLMSYGRDLDKEGGEILGTVVALQGLSAFGDIRTQAQLKWHAELSDKIKIQRQEEATKGVSDYMQSVATKQYEEEMGQQEVIDNAHEQALLGKEKGTMPTPLSMEETEAAWEQAQRDHLNKIMSSVEGPKAGVSELEVKTSNDPRMKTAALAIDAGDYAKQMLANANPTDPKAFDNDPSIRTPLKDAAEVIANQKGEKPPRAAEEVAQAITGKGVSTVETEPNKPIVQDKTFVNKIKTILGPSAEGYDQLRNSASTLITFKGIPKDDPLHDIAVDNLLRRTVNAFKVRKGEDNISQLIGNLNRFSSQAIADVRKKGTVSTGKIMKDEQGNPILSKTGKPIIEREKVEVSAPDEVTENVAQPKPPNPALDSLSDESRAQIEPLMDKLNDARAADAAGKRKGRLTVDQLNQTYKDLGVKIRNLPENERETFLDKWFEGKSDKQVLMGQKILGLTDVEFRQIKASVGKGDEGKNAMWEALDAKATEYAAKKFGYPIVTMTPEEIKSYYKTDAIGALDNDNKRIVISSEATPADRIKTILHEVGHLTFEPNKAADLLATYSRSDVERMKKTFGGLNEFQLAKELHSEAFAKMVEHNFDQLSAPALKQIIYAASNFLEWTGISSVKALQSKGYITDFRISRETASLIGSIREAALYLAGRDPGISRVLGQGKKGVEFSRVRVPLDSNVNDIWTRPKGHPSHMIAAAVTDRYKGFETLNDMLETVRALGVDVPPDDVVKYIQTMTGRADGKTLAILQDPQAGNLKQMHRDLIGHPDGNLLEAYGKWRQLQHLRTIYTQTPKEIEGEGTIRKPVSPYLDSKGNPITLENISKDIAKMETQLGGATKQMFEQFAQREQMFYNRMVDEAKAGGLISDAFAKGMKDNPYYTPLYSLKPLRYTSDSGGRSFGDHGPEYMFEENKGGIQLKVNHDVLSTAGIYSSRMMRAVEENMVNRKVSGFVKLAANLENNLEQIKTKDPARYEAVKAQYMGATEAIRSLVRAGEGDKDMATVKYKVAGKEYNFALANDLHASLKSMDSNEVNFLTAALSSPAILLRYLATAASPTFSLGHFIRYAPNAAIVAPEGMRIGDFLKEFRGALVDTVSHVWNQRIALNYTKPIEDIMNLQSLGGLSSIMLEETRSMGSQILKGLKLQSATKETSLTPGIGGRIRGGIEAMAEVSEITTRLMIFRALKDKVGEERAAMASRSVMDYQRGGYLTRQINMLVPFFNARVQEADVMSRALYKLIDPKSTTQDRMTAGLGLLVRASIATGAMSAIQMSYAALTNKKEDALAADQNMWNKYFMFPIASTQHQNGEKSVSYITIPKSAAHQLLFNPIEALLRDTIQKAGMMQTTKDFFSSFLSAMTPINPVKTFPSTTENAFYTLTQLLGPVGTTAAQQIANKEFFSGRSIVSKGQENWNLPDQYTADTARINRALGSLTGWSPARIQSALSSIGLTGDIPRIMKVADLIVPVAGTTLPQEKQTGIAKLEASPLTSAVIKESGYTNPLSTAENNPLFQGVNSTVQRDNAIFRRRLQEATTQAIAGDTSALRQLKTAYRGKTEWVNQINDIQSHLGSEYNQMVTDLKSIQGDPMKAVALINLTQSMDSSQRMTFLNQMRSRRVMTDQVSSYYRRFSRALDSGMSQDDFNSIVSKAYLSGGR